MGDQLKAANDLMAAAEKALKGGFFRSADPEKACVCVGKAALIYKNMRNFKQAELAYEREAGLQEGLESFFHAAKALENAAMMAKEQSNLSQSTQYYIKAINLYQVNGVNDTCILAREKLAKMLETESPREAIEHYTAAADLCMDEDRYNDAEKYYNKGACICVKLKDYPQAVTLLQQVINRYKQSNAKATNCSKAYLGAVIILLVQGDIVSANHMWQEGVSYCGGNSVEIQLAGKVWSAYDEGDQEGVEEVVKKPQIGHLENEIAKLSRSLRVPGEGIKKKSTTTTNGNNDRSNLSTNHLSPLPVATGTPVLPTTNGPKEIETNMAEPGGRVLEDVPHVEAVDARLANDMAGINLREKEEEEDEEEGGLC